MTNQPPFNMQYYLSVLITKTVLYLLQTDALVFPDLQPGESKQKQHNSCSAESFLHGPILPHELWVKPYSGISPRPNQIIKSEHSWHNPVHVFTEIMYFTEILKFCHFFFQKFWIPVIVEFIDSVLTCTRCKSGLAAFIQKNIQANSATTLLK